MTTWATHLFRLGFAYAKEKDGSERYHFIPGVRTTSLWTLIFVKPIDSCWQVIYSRSEDQVGFWRIYSNVIKIEVNFHSNSIIMINEITTEIGKKPGFLRGFS